MSAQSSACGECRALIGGYVLGGLEPSESDAVASHLAICDECAGESAGLSTIPVLLDLTEDESVPLEPPAELEGAVIDSFAKERGAPRGRSGSWRREGRRFPRLSGALALSAVAAALVLAMVVIVGQGPSSPDAYQARLAGAGGATALARLVTFSGGTHVRLNVSGLRGAPDAVYELWCVRDDGARVSAGTFRVDRRGRAIVDLTTAALPTQYHRMSIDRQLITSQGARDERVLAGSISYDRT